MKKYTQLDAYVESSTGQIFPPALQPQLFMPQEYDYFKYYPFHIK